MIRNSHWLIGYNNEFFKDLKTKQLFIHTEDTYDKTKWNNWNISSLHMWDSLEDGFLHNENTHMLYRTNEFEIGKSRPKAKI